MLPRRDHSGPASAKKKWHEQVKGFVNVAGEDERREARGRDVDAEFLLQFADQAALRGLSRLDLAAWEFPKARELLSLRPLADQDPPVDVDQGAGNDQEERLLAQAPAASAAIQSR
jgi:hypothetical protein